MQKSYKDKNWLEQKYWSEKLSTRAIAKLCDVAKTTIRRWLMEFNIKIRTHNEALGGEYCSEETRKKLSIARTGIHLSEETKKKISKATMGKNNPNWGKNGKNSSAWKGGRTKDGDGYVLIYKPDHPYPNSHHYVYEHRLIMEKKLGRYLTNDEVVHHINGVKDDNREENLKLINKKTHKTDYASAYQDGFKTGLIIGYRKAMSEIAGKLAITSRGY